MRILIAPDSYKGTLPAPAVAQAIAAGIAQARPAFELQCLPLADGGEGTLDVVLDALGGERHSATVRDAEGSPRSADFGVIRRDGTATAVLEAAQVVGWRQTGQGDVMRRSAYGLGELLRHCLDQGLRHFLIGLGGTATNDGGAGLLAALGARFHAVTGEAIAPTPEGLARLERVDWSGLDARLSAARITLLADVDHPLCGPQGATAVFGPQKGVRAADIPRLDMRLARLAAAGDAHAGAALSLHPGAGAAGGLGYALMLCGAELRSGAETLCGLLRLDTALAGADWVVTGEGRTDAQTLRGKLPWVVAQHARRAGVPTLLLSGSIDAAMCGALERSFAHRLSLVDAEVGVAQALADGAAYLAQRARDWARHL